MERLYYDLLNALKVERRQLNLVGSAQPDDSLAEYLRSLKPHVKTLYNSFRAETIKIDFSSEEVQFAYLFRYFPAYAKMTQRILETLIGNALSFQDETLEICLFGAGPAPEILGLISVLSRDFPEVKTLNFHLFDIANETWSISRNLIEKHIIPKYWKGSFSIASYTLDLCQENALFQFRSILQNSHLLIFQNCLNELKQLKNFLANLNFLIEHQSSKSNLIIADFSQYVVTQTVIHHLEAHSKSEICLQIEKDRSLDVRFRNLPPELRSHLLDGSDGCIPRSKVKCSFMLVNQQSEAGDSDLWKQLQYQMSECKFQLSQLDRQIQSALPQFSETVVHLETELQELNQNSERFHQEYLAQLNQREETLSTLILQENHILKHRIRAIRFLLIGIIGFQLVTFAIALYLLFR